MPPAPKPPELRVRSHTPSTGEWRTIGDPASEHPNHPTGCPHDRCYQAWEAWWSDAVSGMWSEAQRDMVSDLAVLFCAWLSEPAKASLYAEVRQIKTALGLTARGLRDLRWRYPDPQPVASVTEVTVKPDPRRPGVS